jgi:hypothetical protein
VPLGTPVTITVDTPPQPGEPLDLDDQLASDPAYRTFVESLGSWAPPQPGDTVRGTVTLDGEYVFPNGIRNEYGDIFWFPTNTPFQVIARAKPAVPEEPAGEVGCVQDESGMVFFRDFRDDDDDVWVAGTMEFLWADLWDLHGPLYKVERGPVIGG